METIVDTAEQIAQQPEELVPDAQENQTVLTEQVNTAVQEQMAQYAVILDELKRQTEAKKLEQMTPEERFAYEKATFEAEMAAKQAELTDKANRIYAAGKVSEYGFPQEYAGQIIEMIMADDEAEIDEKAAGLRRLVDAISKSDIEAKFKSAGYTPKGLYSSGANLGDEAARTRNAVPADTEFDPWK